ncbi:Serine protease 57 [Dissostichus eleginoides]|uniref:Serine protease 57 n=1 Tax=Dissostichus eleginoides TaxID=100907 RepID=A0AAD9C808_DISEL|nr:Serine protease 57 [Dissostichus eleginoides]
MVVLGTHHLRKPRNKIKEHIESTCKPPPGIGTDIMLIKGLMVLILLEEEMLPLILDRTWPRCKSEDATTQTDHPVATMRGLYKILLLFLLACQDQNVLGSKIINGKIADDKLMKYMVSVQEDDEHICGGFLVSKHFVVTHGGCKCDEDGMVVLGTHDLSKPRNKIKRHIISTCKPPPGIGTDIMLIKINQTKPDDLPEEIQLQDPETDVKENENPKACKDQIPGLRANAICTGGKQTTDNGGFCKSDAGGPLVCKGKAVGIATVDDKCSFPGLPNVYIDISKYRSWIDSVLNADGCSMIPKAIAPDDSFEFLVSLQKNEKHVCGGFLISEDFVLTAAQCSAEVPDRVVVGTHDLLNVGDENLTRKVAGNKKQIIALPPSNMHIQENKICHVAGWGFIKTGGGVVDKLMMVDVSVINLDTCSQLWGTSFPSDVICAGGYGSRKGFCQHTLNVFRRGGCVSAALSVFTL